MPKNSNSGSDLATYIASNAELLTEQNYTDIDALVFAEIIHRGFYGWGRNWYFKKILQMPDIKTMENHAVQLLIYNGMADWKVV